MQTYSFLYNDNEGLEQFSKYFAHKEDENILIQAFTSQNNLQYIQQLVKNLLSVCPNAKIIGTTTSGEISLQGMCENSTVLSVSIFKNTNIKTHIIEASKSSFDDGKQIMQPLIKTKKPKLIFTFSDGLYTNGEEYLNGITDVDNNIIIAGGMAGDYSKFEVTYIFNEKKIISQGAVAAALYNDELNIFTEYNFNWESLGRTHKITKSHKNRVYKIDDMTPVEFYAKYLGDEIKDLLPSIGIEFPLVIQSNNQQIARAVLTKHDDGSLSFAGNIKEGSSVKFAYGNVNMIIKDSIDQIKNIYSHPVEAIFIYSCMARKALLQEDVNLELLPLKEIAPISGFFTYGEFFHKNNKNKLLNETMTIIALSEGNKIHKPNKVKKYVNEKNEIPIIRTKALSKLIETTSEELDLLNAELEQKVQQEIKKRLENEELLLVQSKYAQFGEILDMIAHQWRQPLSAISTATSSLQLQLEYGQVTNDILQSVTNNIMKYVGFLDNTIEDFRNFFKVSKNKDLKTTQEIYEDAYLIIEALEKKYDFKVITEFNCTKKVSVVSSEMTQVILNLIKNAIDAIVENKITQPKILFKTFEHNKRCIMQIEDNGGGIPKDIMPKIFNKRFTTKGDTHGTGIGLDMSKTIIEKKMDGMLTCENGKDGAIFSISLPIC
jgi:signal transduction histidine kinase